MARPFTLVLCLALLALIGCSAPILTVGDAIVGPRGRTTLSARVERTIVRGVSDSVEGVAVEFRVARQIVGTATTDGHGRAVVECTLKDADVRSFAATAAWPGGEAKASGRLFYWSPDRSAIAVDIDKTICATDRGHLYSRDSDDSEPIEGAREVLEILAADYDIVYLTARPRFLAGKTRAWLAAHGFPRAPLLTARSWRAFLRQERFKRHALASVRRDAPNLLIGIGDKQLDARAYTANHMLAIRLGGERVKPADPPVVVLRDWNEIRHFFEINRSVLAAPERLRRLLAGTLDSPELIRF